MCFLLESNLTCWVGSTSQGDDPTDLPKDRWFYLDGLKWKKPAKNDDIDIKCVDVIRNTSSLMPSTPKLKETSLRGSGWYWPSQDSDGIPHCY